MLSREVCGQASQRQRTACRCDVVRDDRRDASPVEHGCDFSALTAKTTASYPLRRGSPRPSDVRFSCGTEGRSFSTEHRHTCGLVGDEQHDRAISHGPLELEARCGFAACGSPFASHAPVAGPKPAGAMAAISNAETTDFVRSRNIAIPISDRDLPCHFLNHTHVSQVALPSPIGSPMVTPAATYHVVTCKAEGYERHFAHTVGAQYPCGRRSDREARELATAIDGRGRNRSVRDSGFATCRCVGIHGNRDGTQRLAEFGTSIRCIRRSRSVVGGAPRVLR